MKRLVIIVALLLPTQALAGKWVRIDLDTQTKLEVVGALPDRGRNSRDQYCPCIPCLTRAEKRIYMGWTEVIENDPGAPADYDARWDTRKVDKSSCSYDAPTEKVICDITYTAATNAAIWRYWHRQVYTRLAATDWTQRADAPLSGAQKTAFATYREELRQTKALNADPRDVVLPDPPASTNEWNVCTWVTC